MARSSQRNFLTLFRAVDVDDAEGGPEVSQNIQLVYVADDVRQRSYIYGGAGVTEAAVVGEHGFGTLECRVPGGVEVLQVTMDPQVAAFDPVVRMWTTATLPTITGAANLITTLRTTGLLGLPAAPLSQMQSGTIATAAIPANTFRWIPGHTSWVGPFFINQGQFFNVAAGSANTLQNIGIMWRELRLFP